MPHTVVPAPVSKRARPTSSRTMSFGILASGALIVALVAGFVLVSALPRLARANNQALSQAYPAPIPGPNCDTGGATWTVTPGSPIETHCLATGLQVEARPKVQGSVEFIPPSGSFPANYRVSVSVRFAGSNACATIYTRSTSAGHYLSNICPDGTWWIQRIDPAVTLLAIGQVTKAATYQLEATSNGDNQRLVINGIEVSTLADSVFPSTAFLNLGIITGNAGAAVVVFSNFVFAPLPASTSSVPPTTYRASTPGPNCDKGGAQWAILYSVEANAKCQQAGMQVEARARSQGEVAFTPPGNIFSPNYQASAQIDLSQMPGGCAGFQLRAFGANSYGYGVCATGFWKIYLLQGTRVRSLNSGFVAPATRYTMEATADGPHLRLVLNGAIAGTAFDATLTTSAFIAFGFANPSSRAGAIVFSNFVFTPLP